MTTTAPITALPDGFRPLRSDEYDQLIDAGAFETSDGSRPRIELVGGVLVEMSPQSDPHIALIMVLNRIFVQQSGDQHVVGTQVPIVTDEYSQPEPDLMILPVRDYFGRKPDDALLVVEISSSRLRFDLGEKALRYAAAGVPDYWVIDVLSRVVHVHRGPRPDGTWHTVQQLTSGTLQATAAAGISIDLDELLSW